jgi:DNA-binding transcriptional LysR family regulator
MRLSQLETFAAVARYKNFSRASEVCHLVQSTISHQIQSLEEELGFCLFERNTHNVTLTPAGEQYYRDIEGPLEMMLLAARRARAVSEGETGSISVGVSGINQTERLAVVRKFRENHPGISLAYCRAGNPDSLRKLNDRLFDIMLTKIPEALPEEYEAVDVRLERLYLVASYQHPAATHTRISLEEAMKFPMLFAMRGDISIEKNKQDVIQSFCLSGINLDNILFVEDMDIMQMMIETGEGIAIIPESIISYEQKNLKVIPFSNPPPPIPIGWIYRKDNPNPVLHQFSQYLR